MTALPLNTCIVLRMRSSESRAFLAFPFQIRRCNRSTSATIAVFAWIRPGSSVDNPLAGRWPAGSRWAAFVKRNLTYFSSPFSRVWVGIGR